MLELTAILAALLNLDGFHAGGAMKESLARVEISCVQVGGVSQWAHTTMFTNPPKLGEGSPPLPVVGFSGFTQAPPDSAAPEEPNFSLELVEGMTSESVLQRMRTNIALRELIDGNLLTADERQTLIHRLIAIIDEDRPFELDVEVMNHPKRYAVAMLVDLQAIEAIPTLIEHIQERYPDVYDMERDAKRIGLAAAGALIRLGESAVAPLINRVAQADAEEWDVIAWTLSRIDWKSPLVRQVMDTLLDAQRQLPPPADDEEKAERELIEQRLTEFLKTPEPKRPKPQPGPEALAPLGPEREASSVMPG